MQHAARSAASQYSVRYSGWFRLADTMGTSSASGHRYNIVEGENVKNAVKVIEAGAARDIQVKAG